MLTLKDQMPADFTGRVASNNDFMMADEDGYERVCRQAWDFVDGQLVGSTVVRSSAVLYRTQG